MVGFLNLAVGFSDYVPGYRSKINLSVHATPLNPLCRNMHMFFTQTHWSLCCTLVRDSAEGQRLR